MMNWAIDQNETCALVYYKLCLLEASVPVISEVWLNSCQEIMGSLLSLKTLLRLARFATLEDNVTVDKLVMLLMVLNVCWENKHQSPK